MDYSDNDRGHRVIQIFWNDKVLPTNSDYILAIFYDELPEHFFEEMSEKSIMQASKFIEIEFVRDYFYWEYYISQLREMEYLYNISKT